MVCATIPRVTVADATAHRPWPPVQPPEPTYVDDRLNHWAEARPDQEAMRHLGRTWTWAQLHERVHRAAGGLRDLCIARGDVVAFLGDDHPASVEITMAAGSIGAANAVIDGRLAGDELVEAVAGCGAEVLFVGADVRDAVAAVRDRLPDVRRVVAVMPDGAEGDEYEAFLTESINCDDGPDVLEDDVCLIEGGRPLTHRDLVARSADADDVYGRIHDGRPSVIAPPA